MLSLWLASALALGCGGGDVTDSDWADGSVTRPDGVDSRLDGGSAKADARAASGDDEPGDDGDDLDPSTGTVTADAGMGGGSGGSCGDVEAADHAPFRAIQKLATTRDEVRVLVYGQSISEQAWWEKTKAWLAQTYPNGKLVMEEHARGGCAAQCLLGHVAWPNDGQQYNRLPADVFAWKPDLVIFHVYGDHSDYQYIMRGLKEGCAAFDDYKSVEGQSVPQVRCTDAQRAMSAGYQAPEVLVQNDFVNKTDPDTCAADPQPAQWDCFMNNKIIPDVVKRQGYALQDNFHGWKRETQAEGLQQSDTIDADETHLSPQGNDVMFNLTVPHLCYAP